MRIDLSKLNVYVKLFEQMDTTLKSLKNCTDIMNDPREDKEMREFAKEDYQVIMQQVDDMQAEIEDEIVPKREIDSKNCTIEIRQAAGGSESSLFAEDLVNMYKQYAQNMGLRCIEEEFTQDLAIGKGCKHAVYKIIGEDAYKYFKHESGVHK